MTTNVDLIAEARRIHTGCKADDCNALQVANALEAAEARLAKALECHASSYPEGHNIDCPTRPMSE